MNVQRFFYWLADRCRESHDNGLPAKLQLSSSRANRFAREEMLRDARMTKRLDVPFGIFQLIGSEHAARAARTVRPKALLLMEDLSLAFDVVERQRHRGIVVADDDIERLVRLLHTYLVDRLDLHPWTDASRFDKLQEKYASLLRLPPDVR